jgi:4-hydroxy-tetrahydrodipicolinate reductase
MVETALPNGAHVRAGGRRYRVVQWATGNVGARALRRVIEHPDLELVGVHAHNPDKIGRDAGELVGIAPVGVRVTGSLEQVVALKPDCVLYMPHQLQWDEVCRLLESGANVVTTRTELQNPKTMDPGVRARVMAACERGQTSIHGTGSSPGFITEALPIVLASMQRRLDCLTIYEFADNTTRNSPEMLFGQMGFGATPQAGLKEGILLHMKEAFGGALALTAEALGLPLDGVEVSGGVGVARKDVRIAAGLVPKGTVAATRTVVSGMRGGKPLMRFVATWYVSADVDTVDEDWIFRESGWRVLVEGDCPLDIGITFPVAQENYADMTPGLTAHRPVNAIPYVCAARPGIRTTSDLPQVIARLG